MGPVTKDYRVVHAEGVSYGDNQTANQGDIIALDAEAEQTKTLVEGGFIEDATATPTDQPDTTPDNGGAQPPAPEAGSTQPDTPVEQSQPAAGGSEETRFAEANGKHFWKRYDASGALVFTSQPFDTEEDAKADAERAGTAA